VIEVIPYGGWKRALKLSNTHCELVMTLEVGPRVIHYSAPGGFNVMKQYASMMGGTDEPEWQIRGGHRFWLAPEDLTRTYYPDNAPVELTQHDDLRVTLTPPPETEYGVQKTMTLTLNPDDTKVSVTLTVANIGTAPTELAPWGPTVLAAGGVEIIPLPPKAPHPGHPKNASSPADYAPDQVLVFWPYFDFSDPRWTFGSRYIFLRQDVTRGPTKLGVAHHLPWVAYLNSNVLFVKKFNYRDGAVYPDRGTRYQTFSYQEMLEMETVGELVTLQPGASASLTEAWELHTGVPSVRTEEDADRVILPLVR